MNHSTSSPIKTITTSPSLSGTRSHANEYCMDVDDFDLIIKKINLMKESIAGLYRELIDAEQEIKRIEKHRTTRYLIGWGDRDQNYFIQLERQIDELKILFEEMIMYYHWRVLEES